MSRILIFSGIILILIGVGWSMGERLGLGSLPGDIAIQKGNFSFHFPIVTCLLLSAVLSVLWRVMGYFFQD